MAQLCERCCKYTIDRRRHCPECGPKVADEIIYKGGKPKGGPGATRQPGAGAKKTARPVLIAPAEVKGLDRIAGEAAAKVVSVLPAVVGTIAAAAVRETKAQLGRRR